MIVLVIHQDDVFFLEAKGHPPVSTDGYRPVPFQFSLEAVKLPARNIDILRARRVVQHGKLPRQLVGMSRLDAAFLSGKKESFQTLVAEALYHT